MAGFFYIMASRYRGTLYAGVTNDMVRRGFEHREGLVKGFTRTYGIKLLVHFEYFEAITDAIHRERSSSTGYASGRSS